MTFTFHEKQQLVDTQSLNRIIIGLALLMFLLMMPLGFRLNEQLLKGDSRPMAYPLSVKLYQALKNKLATEEGVDYLLGGRPGAERPNDVVLWLKANKPIPQTLIEDLKQICKDILGDEAKPLVVPLQLAPVVQDGDSRQTTSATDNNSRSNLSE